MIRMRRHDCRGVLATEVVVSIALMFLIAGLTASALMDHHHARDEAFYRRAASWAAAGQLQRYQAGALIDSLPPAEMVGRAITLETRVHPGQGQWEGLDRVEIIATATLPSSKRVAETIRGYVARTVRP